MKKLDWYIINKFLSTFFFTVLIFVMIGVIIDFSEKVEDFIEEPITTREILLGYYPNFILFVTGLLWPLFTLIAVIFFTSRMAANSEIISVFNAGVSFRRLLRPYFLAATFLFILHVLGSHFVIPRGNETMLTIVYTYFKKNSDDARTNNVHIFIAPDTKVFIELYRKRDSTMRDFRLEHFDSNRLVYLLKAQKVSWLGPPNRWRLSEYEIRTFDGQEETIRLGRGQQLDTTLNLAPADFVDFASQQSMMTTPELLSFIQKLRERGAGNVRKYLIELQRRFAEPFTIYILTLIGAAIAARKVRGGIGLHLAMGIGLGAAFIFLSRFSIVFADSPSVPVALGIWLPNLIFAAIAVVLVSRAQK